VGEDDTGRRTAEDLFRLLGRESTRGQAFAKGTVTPKPVSQIPEPPGVPEEPVVQEDPPAGGHS
jgi:hypothetical protein